MYYLTVLKGNADEILSNDPQFKELYHGCDVRLINFSDWKLFIVNRGLAAKSCEDFAIF